MARNNIQNANLASEFYIASQLFRLEVCGNPYFRAHEGLRIENKITKADEAKCDPLCIITSPLKPS